MNNKSPLHLSLSKSIIDIPLSYPIAVFLVIAAGTFLYALTGTGIDQALLVASIPTLWLAVWFLAVIFLLKAKTFLWLTELDVARRGWWLIFCSVIIAIGGNLITTEYVKNFFDHLPGMGHLFTKISETLYNLMLIGGAAVGANLMSSAWMSRFSELQDVQKVDAILKAKSEEQKIYQQLSTDVARIADALERIARAKERTVNVEVPAHTKEVSSVTALVETLLVLLRKR